MFQEVQDNIFFVSGKDQGQYPYANSLFINDQKKLLIDTGIGRVILKKLLKQFGEPDIILYSHAHEDHVPLEKLVPNAQKYIHSNDHLMATSIEELFRIYGLGENLEFQKFIYSYFKSFYYRPLTKVETFEDGKVFELGDYQVKILHFPGHSAGHSGFEVVNKSLIFSSDIDLTSFGPWYGGLDSSIPEFKQSINVLIQNPPDTIITSHKGVYQGSEVKEKLGLYLKKFEEREEKLLSLLETKQTLEELIPQALIYGKFYEPEEYFFASERIMLEKHLAILLANNKVELHEGSYKTL